MMLLLVLMLAVGGQAAGQVVTELASPSEEGYGYFGLSVGAAGDVNGDGCDDVVVGAYGEDPGASPSGCGRAYIFSGADGACLDTLVSPNEEADGRFGHSVAGAGDVNGDGHVDVIVGAQLEDPGASPAGAGRAYVFSGADGSCLDTLMSPNEEADGYFAVSVSGAGDVDDDGRDDIIVGASNEDLPGSPNDAGCAYVFSGTTGECLDTLVSPNEQYLGHFGRCVSGAGDVDEDGHDDVIVGAYQEDAVPSGTDAGRAYVFGGAAGNVVLALTSPMEDNQGNFGWSVSGAGDVDGDGSDDVLVGAPGEDGAGQVSSGRAYIFSGATGDTLRTLISPNAETSGRFGFAVSSAGDVDFDNHPDAIVGAFDEDPGSSPGGAGRAYIFSGADGALLYTLVSPNEESGGRLGFYVSRAGDTDNDVIVGAPREDPQTSPADAGRAYIYTLAMTLWGDVSAGQLVLDWPDAPGASAYWLYGADNWAYFGPGFSPPHAYRLVVLPSGTTTWSTSSGIGDPDHNWTYLVAAVDATDQVLFTSNRFGEHDFGWVMTR
jgi:hypothetical protein